MIGIVMAGGKGTRMNLDGEKLLLRYKKPVILHVCDSLRDSNCFSKILAITSSNSPKTKKLLQENNVDILDSSGSGYVEDLNLVLQVINETVFVTSGDLPLLDKTIIQKILNQLSDRNVWTSILVTHKFLNSLGLKSDYSIIVNDQKCVFTGISLIDSRRITSLGNVAEKYVIVDDKRIAFNLNTKQDYDLLGTA